MEHSRDNIVKLLRAMSKRRKEESMIMPELYTKMINRALAYDVAAAAIIDEKYFNALCKIYELTESED